MSQEYALNLDELKRIASVLMGAAHADGSIDGSEAQAVADILTQLVGGASLPGELRSHLEGFNPSGFDLASVCGALKLSAADDRRALLALVAEVTDADDIHTCDEDDYIIQVAKHIGSAPEEYADLTMGFAFISTVSPPPVPDDAT